MVVIQAILWVLLIVSIFLLIGVILLQEGKGGGLAEAFGGVGAETFGVKAAGINKFTSIVATVFLGLCIALTLFKTAPSTKPIASNAETSPFDPSDLIPGPSKTPPVKNSGGAPPAGKSDGGSPPK